MYAIVINIIIYASIYVGDEVKMTKNAYSNKEFVKKIIINNTDEIKYTKMVAIYMKRSV